MSTIKLGIIMDPIANITPHKDTGLALLLAAQKRGWQLYYMEKTDLFFSEGQAFAQTKTLTVQDSNSDWYYFTSEQNLPLAELDIILMRQDPPFDMNYIYVTYMLEHAERTGTLVINKPQSLRDANEKFFTTHFPQCIPPSLISSQKQLIKSFINQHQDVILKPLDAMGGRNIFRVTNQDFNSNVIIEILTHGFSTPIIAQRYLPEIEEGDKRIILIDGEPVPYGLVRLPQVGETRANIAAGGNTKIKELTKRDYWLCEQIAPALKQKGLLLTGIDVIGDYVTEINVTSPTCIRELDHGCDLDICQNLFDTINNLLR